MVLYGPYLTARARVRAARTTGSLPAGSDTASGHLPLPSSSMPTVPGSPCK